NSGKTSNVATYTIPVTALAPLTTTILNTSLSVTAAATPISSLAATDGDGSISSYAIASLPAAASGVLYLCNSTCNPVTVGQTIMAADASKLQFDPAATFTGLYAAFNYSSTDNTGKIGNQALYTIPLFQGVTLPVHLINFTGNHAQQKTILNWTAENEENFSYYGVERSLDGIHFNRVGTVQAISESGSRTYQFEEITGALNSTKIYYRLQLVDRDGSNAYSRILSFNLTTSSTALTVLLNSGTQPVLRLTAKNEGTASLVLLDNNGRLLEKKSISVNTGNNLYPITAASQWSSGIYLAQLTFENITYTQRIAIRH
ncbi:MAG TPA: T9SS type A sorting domain-containing protein, partial [Flavisolibacter sp.]|nr:T9SS type A sorting domain-containing protein [Flavisolibacter sp.]